MKTMILLICWDVWFLFFVFIFGCRLYIICFQGMVMSHVLHVFFFHLKCEICLSNNSHILWFASCDCWEWNKHLIQTHCREVMLYMFNCKSLLEFTSHRVLSPPWTPATGREPSGPDLLRGLLTCGTPHQLNPHTEKWPPKWGYPY